MNFFEEIGLTKKPQQTEPDYTNERNLIDEKFQALNDKLDFIANQIIHSIQVSEPVQRIETFFAQSTYVYSANGYRYNGIIIADSMNGTTLSIKSGSLKYTQTVYAGFNPVNFPDGAEITPSQDLQCVLIRYNFELKQSGQIISTSAGGNAGKFFSGNANQTLAFTTLQSGLVVSNDSATSSLSVQVNGITYTVNKGETFQESFFPPFSQAVITATDNWRAYGRA